MGAPSARCRPRARSSSAGSRLAIARNRQAPASGEPALDRVERDLARSCDVGKLEPLDEAERERNSIVGPEAIEDGVGRAQRLHHLRARRARCGHGQIGRRKKPEPAPARPAAKALAGRDDGDSREPALQRVRVLQGVDELERPDEHLVQQIAELGVAPQDPQQDPLDCLGMAIE